MLDVILDTIIDGLKMLPFLYITYLIMEFIERKAGDKTKQKIKSAGKVGPLWGALLGAFPQCGFSAGASGLYVGRIVSLGTLIAIYLSTSDEMLPIFISESVPILTIVKILGIKIVIGMISGFIIEIVMSLVSRNKKEDQELETDYVEVDHRNCTCNHKKSIWLTALGHTLKIFVFIFIISLILNLVIYFLGEEALAELFVDTPVVGELIAGLVGLIPNCAASVVITELYLQGIINAGAMMSGLLVGAGAGTLILFREGKSLKEKISIIALLYVLGVIWGCVIEFAQIAF